MIYLDTSVVLAQLLAEDRRPPVSLWDEALVASRLMEYEVWTRLHARGLAESHGEAASGLIGRVALLELSPPVLARAPWTLFPCLFARLTPCIWRHATTCATKGSRSRLPATTIG